MGQGYLRVAVAQIPDLKVPYDHLRDQEPGWDKLTRGLRAQSSIAAVLNRVQACFDRLHKNQVALFTDHAMRYMEAIFDFCNRRRVHVLVLPEYALPPQCLPRLCTLLDDPRRRIPAVIASTHIYGDCGLSEQYAGLRLEEPRHRDGPFFVAPVLLSDHSGYQGGKLIPKCTDTPAFGVLFGYRQADWTPDIEVPVRLHGNADAEDPLSIRVLTCSDAINAEAIAQSNGLGRPRPNLIAVPSWTPYETVSDYYEANFRTFRRGGIPTGFANVASAQLHSEYGGSMIFSTVEADYRFFLNESFPVTKSVCPIARGSAAVSINDVWIPHPPRFSDQPWSTQRGTVAPIVSEAAFPEYCRFWDGVVRLGDVRDPFSGSDAKREQIVSVGAAVCADTLRLSHCRGVFQAKLKDVEFPLRDRTVMPLIPFADPHDLERLVDVVVLPRTLCGLPVFYDELEAALTELMTRAPRTARPEITTLLHNVQERRQQLLAPVELEVMPPETPVPARPAGDLSEPARPSLPAVVASDKERGRLHDRILWESHAVNEAICIVTVIQHLWSVSADLQYRTTQHLHQLMGCLRQLLLIKSVPKPLQEDIDAITTKVASEFSPPAETAGHRRSDRSLLEPFGERGVGATEKTYWKAILQDQDKAREWALSFLQAADALPDEFHAEKPPRGQPHGPGRVAMALTPEEIKALAETIEEESTPRFEHFQSTDLSKCQKVLEQARVHLQQSENSWPDAVQRVFTQGFCLGLACVCTCEPELVVEGLIRCIDNLCWLAEIGVERTMARLYQLTREERGRMIESHRQSFSQLRPAIVAVVASIVSAPAENWRRYPEAAWLIHEYLRIEQELIILDQRHLLDLAV